MLHINIFYSKSETSKKAKKRLIAEPLAFIRGKRLCSEHSKVAVKVAKHNHKLIQGCQSRTCDFYKSMAQPDNSDVATVAEVYQIQ